MCRFVPMANKAPLFTVYSREGCHLCEAMIDEIRVLQRTTAFEVEIIDVDGSDELKQRFGLLVPVLTCEGSEICHYFLDPEAVNAYLINIR